MKGNVCSERRNGVNTVCLPLGQSGLGKSTLMNTLFKSKVSRKSAQPDPEERIPKTIEIKSISHGELPLVGYALFFCRSTSDRAVSLPRY